MNIDKVGINKANLGLYLMVGIIILIFIITGSIDIYNVSTEKNNLSNMIDQQIEPMISSNVSNEDIYKIINKDIDDNKININIEINGGEEYATVTLTRNVNLCTPIINYFISNPYTVQVRRVVYPTSTTDNVEES